MVWFFKKQEKIKSEKYILYSSVWVQDIGKDNRVLIENSQSGYPGTGICTPQTKEV